MSQEFEGSNPARPVLHHVNLKTTRLQEMIDWYSTTVGLTTIFQFPGGAYAGEFPPSSPMDPRIPLDDPRVPL
ncbi:MAG TPA: hypothetical protein VJ761_02265 [Ktedonobacteraceae bacterium]|nr:hypothetical protein [Ktedonobacteraceae bacterium]